MVLDAGPPYPGREENAGGVGVVARAPRSMVKAQPKTLACRAAMDSGRLLKVHCNAAEGFDIIIFNLYGKAGGSADPEAAAVTEVLLDAVEEDMQDDMDTPCIICGEPNARPQDIPKLEEMLEHAWNDVCAMSGIWGARGGETTCRISGHAKESRIDYIITNNR